MLVKPFLKTSLALAAACTLWAGSAQATVHNINLSGVVADGFYHPPFTIGATTFSQWSIGLSGLDGMNTLEVAQGDIVNVTVTLDQLFTVPASGILTSFGLGLGGQVFPVGDTATANNVFDFFNGMALVKSGNSGSVTSSGQIPAVVIFFPPDNTAFSFDSLFASFEISDLSAPATLDYSVMSYTLFNPAAVPEPTTWAMMIIGFGGVGALMRRRRRDGGLAAFA
jgi:hypothetical protein